MITPKTTTQSLNEALCMIKECSGMAAMDDMSRDSCFFKLVGMTMKMRGSATAKFAV